MLYNCIKMSQEQATNIASNWHYDGKYSFYDIDADKEDLVEFLDPNKRKDSHFIVKKGQVNSYIV